MSACANRVQVLANDRNILGYFEAFEEECQMAVRVRRHRVELKSCRASFVPTFPLQDSLL